jgi:DUF1009 family protein
VFPVLVARGARARGRRVVCAALQGHAWPNLREECDCFEWVRPAKLDRLIKVLRLAGCEQAIMVGRVAKSQMYDRFWYLRYIPDLRALRFIWRIWRHDKRPQALLQGLIEEFASSGITLIDSTQFCSEHIVTPGVMTRRQPTDAQWADIRLGYEVCQTISRFDIGQSIAVLGRDVLAVEALEGTNAMIERAGKLCKVGGWSLIKVANARRDMRVDVPAVGTTTIEKLAAARAACLVLEPGKTMMLEKQKVLEMAERYKIVVVGWDATMAGAADSRG